MLQLRGPKYVMQEEINELGLVSLTQESGGFFDKLKEIRSRAILYPVNSIKNSDKENFYIKVLKNGLKGPSMKYVVQKGWTDHFVKRRCLTT